MSIIAGAAALDRAGTAHFRVWPRWRASAAQNWYDTPAE
jgi:hypothetical protein